MNTETDLGREVRAEVAAILAKYNGKHEAIAGVKVETIRKIDRLINPEPEGFEIDTRNDRPYHTELALKQAARIRALDQAGNYDAVLATVENHRAAGLRETAERQGA